jgi:hypothetical protein
MKRKLAIAAVLIAVFSAAVYGAIPRTLNFQGVLTDAGGSAVPDGIYSIVFSLYDVAVGGTAEWTETQDNVTVTKGIFSVILGSNNPLDIAFDERYYLGIAVEGEAELAPRVELTSSAYAFNSRAMMGSDNIFPSAGNVGIGTLFPNHPLTVFGSDALGIQFNGSGSSWAGIYANAMQPSGQPVFGYTRSGLLKASTYVDTSDRWHCHVNNEIRLTVNPDGNVNIGAITPNQKLVVDGAIRIGTTAVNDAGSIRWTGADFEGYDGSTWYSLTSNGGSGSLPPGTTGQTLRHNGADWVTNSFLYNNGSNIGIGTTIPSSELHIYHDANSTTSIKIENPNTGANSTQRIDFADENGTVAGLAIFDDDSGYSSEMHLFNNRPGGSLELSAGANAVMIQNDGDVGVGVDDPNATLHVKGGNWDLDATNGDLKIGNDNNRLKIGVAIDGLGAGTAGIRMQGGLEKLVLGGGSNEVVTIESGGTVSLGSDVLTGTLNLYQNGVAGRVASLGSWGVGGSLYLYDESNNPTVAAEPDFNGTGGWFGVRRSEFIYGLTVEGNYGGLEEPRVTIAGSSRSAAFNMDQTGNNSVLLPISSVSSQELYNEPGVTSNRAHDTGGLALSGTGYDVITSSSITVPDAGYVLVIATAQVDFGHTTGTETYANVGVSNVDTGLPAAQDIQTYLPSDLPTDTYRLGITRHNLFIVGDTGTTTFYFIGRLYSGSCTVYDVQLSLVYLPTTYGTVAPLTAGVAGDENEVPIRGPLTQAEIAAERSESEQANMVRIQHELDAMRAELDEIKRGLENKR